MDDFIMDWKIRTFIGMSVAPRYKTIKRPSWLHPLRRVLWAHRYGQHLPERKVLIGNPRSLGVIKGITL